MKGGPEVIRWPVDEYAGVVEYLRVSDHAGFFCAHDEEPKSLFERGLVDAFYVELLNHPQENAGAFSWLVLLLNEPGELRNSRCLLLGVR